MCQICATFKSKETEIEFFWCILVSLFSFFSFLLCHGGSCPDSKIGKSRRPRFKSRLVRINILANFSILSFQFHLFFSAQNFIHQKCFLSILSTNPKAKIPTHIPATTSVA